MFEWNVFFFFLTWAYRNNVLNKTNNFKTISIQSFIYEFAHCHVSKVNKHT